MTVAGLRRALGMLLLDVGFYERFFVNRRSATWEAGLPLFPIEVAALSRLSRVAIARFRESLEPSLRRRRARDATVPQRLGRPMGAMT